MAPLALAFQNLVFVCAMIFFDSNPQYKELYMERLGLDPKLLPPTATSSTSSASPSLASPDTASPPPSLDLLRRITEAHLRRIPFENLAQHGGRGGLQSVDDMERLADKILVRRRGGFCYELNGLLGEFLESIGYRITRVPSVVYNPDREVDGFDKIKTHILNIVEAIDDLDEKAGEGGRGGEPEQPSRYLVDVGFGEPAIHPLKYEMGLEQKTAEGMVSRIVSHQRQPTEHNPTTEAVELQKLADDGSTWQPRLQWDCKSVNDAGDDGNGTGPRLSDPIFVSGMSWASTSKDSPFSRKIIACCVTRTTKRTLAGDVYKVTGPPRFGVDTDTVVAKTKLKSLDEAREILNREFGIPLVETAELDLETSASEDPKIWSEL